MASLVQLSFGDMANSAYICCAGVRVKRAEFGRYLFSLRT